MRARRGPSAAAARDASSARARASSRRRSASGSTRTAVDCPTARSRIGPRAGELARAPRSSIGTRIGITRAVELPLALLRERQRARLAAAAARRAARRARPARDASRRGSRRRSATAAGGRRGRRRRGVRRGVARRRWPAAGAVGLSGPCRGRLPSRRSLRRRRRSGDARRSPLLGPAVLGAALELAVGAGRFGDAVGRAFAVLRRLLLAGRGVFGAVLVDRQRGDHEVVPDQRREGAAEHGRAVERRWSSARACRGSRPRRRPCTCESQPTNQASP